MAGLEASSAKPAAAALPQTAQAGPCTPHAGSAATPEQQQQHQQQQQQQPSCAPCQVESCLAALPMMRAEIHGTAQLDQHASSCSAISTMPMPCTIDNGGHNSCGAPQTQLHSSSSAMKMDAGSAQDSHAAEGTVGTAEDEAAGSNQLAGQVQGATGGLAASNGPSGAGEAPGLSRGSGVASEDAALASKGHVQEADGDDILPAAAGCFSEGMYPVGVTTYTQASAFAPTPERAGICVFLP